MREAEVVDTETIPQAPGTLASSEQTQFGGEANAELKLTKRLPLDIVPVPDSKAVEAF